MSDLSNLTLCCPIEEARLQIRQLEARGDFKYKGISRLYETIEKMTGDFWVKHQLPSKLTLARVGDLNEDKVLEYLDALLAGQNPVLRKITIIENNPKGDGDRGIPGLATHDVFCRPTKKDGNNCEAYFKEYAGRCYTVLKDFFAKKYKPRTQGELKVWLMENIDNDTFASTYVSHLMMQLFESSFDSSAHTKKIQNEVTVKPIVREMVKGRVLFFAKKQTDHELAFNSILLVQNKEELLARFSVLSEYFQNHILTYLTDNSIISKSDVLEIQEKEGLSDAERVRDLTSLALKNKSKLNQVYYQILSELMIFVPHIIKTRRNEEQEKKKLVLETVIKDLKKSQSLVDIKVHKFGDSLLEDDMARSLIAQDEILHTDFAINKRIGRFVAHQSNLPNLIRGAKTALEVRKNPNELRILMAMGVEDLLEETDKKLLENLELAFISKYINVFKKMMMFLFRRKPDSMLIDQIKKSIAAAQSKDLEQARQEEASQRMKQLEKKVIEKEKKAKEQGKAEVPEAEPEKTPVPVEDLDPEEQKQREMEDLARKEKAKATMDKIVTIIDNAWKKGDLPNRLSVNEHFPDMSEDQLIRFLKQESKGQIRSFRVSYDDPKYQWPILITKRWLQYHGNKMLSDAMAKADEQRKAKFPKQEQFEYYDALETFLNKELTRPK